MWAKEKNEWKWGREKERKSEIIYESRVNENKKKRNIYLYVWERANEQINMKQITVIDFAWWESVFRAYRIIIFSGVSNDRMIESNEECMLTRMKTNVNGSRG